MRFGPGSILNPYPVAFRIHVRNKDQDPDLGSLKIEQTNIFSKDLLMQK